MTLVSLTTKRKEIIDQFPIQDRDAQVYSSIDVAVEDALRRAFRDINFRTMTETKANKSIKSILNQINGSRKIKKFNIGMGFTLGTVEMYDYSSYYGGYYYTEVIGGFTLRAGFEF